MAFLKESLILIIKKFVNKVLFLRLRRLETKIKISNTSESVFIFGFIRDQVNTGYEGHTDTVVLIDTYKRVPFLVKNLNFEIHGRLLKYIDIEDKEMFFTYRFCVIDDGSK